MVALRESTNGRKKAIYLAQTAILSFVTLACSPPQGDVLTLKHRSAQSIAHILERRIDDPESYSLSDQQVIFYEQNKKTKQIKALLRVLDRGPLSYRVQLVPDNIKRYSTQSMPSAIVLIENEASLLQTGKAQISLRIRPLSGNSALLSITEINDAEQVAYHYNIEAPFQQWITTGLKVGLEKLKISPVRQ